MEAQRGLCNRADLSASMSAKNNAYLTVSRDLSLR